MWGNWVRLYTAESLTDQMFLQHADATIYASKVSLISLWSVFSIHAATECPIMPTFCPEKVRDMVDHSVLIRDTWPSSRRASATAKKIMDHANALSMNKGRAIVQRLILCGVCREVVRVKISRNDLPRLASFSKSRNLGGFIFEFLLCANSPETRSVAYVLRLADFRRLSSHHY